MRQVAGRVGIGGSSVLAVGLSVVAVALTAAVPASAQARFTEVLLSLRHRAGLAAFVQSVSDPTSADYRDYASVATLERRFDPGAARSARVLGWLRAHGASAEAIGPVIVARVPERLLAHGIPAPLRPDVASASLAPGARLLPLLTPPSGDLGSGRPRTGTPGGCPQGVNAGWGGRFLGLTPNQITTAYGFSKLRSRGIAGQGERIALVEIDAAIPTDVQRFTSCFGLPAPQVVTHLVGIRRPAPAVGETDLDLEMLAATAPRLARIDVYYVDERGFPGDLLAGLQAALHARGGPPAAISLSLGLCEAELATSTGSAQAVDDELALAAGAGVTTVVAAGDSGSTGCRYGGTTPSPDPLASPALPVISASFPASSPYALAVGGTSVTLTPGNQLQTQVVWNDAPWALRGGGGAPSLFEPRPWWQQGPGLGVSVANGVTRFTPDIAAYADDLPGYAIACTALLCKPLPSAEPGWVALGGTSAVAPLYAAGVALADQDARRHGQRSLGLIDPLIYSLAAGPGARQTFWDVTRGDNDLGSLIPADAGGGGPIGCCSARKGYDAATGWGSVDVSRLDTAALRAGSLF